ncbi:hypothetical protein SEA_MULCH_58 [Gordonia phage Mulch]|uniref:Uncharacterized protein n=4 Tax=Betterkatzvirus betterkatz TaxID=2560485 RepID=A0A2Z5HEI2_9CAUD|nr:hypothetical protein SEA_NADEEM_58 [Gordonia phage Nadeem]AZS11225.1 hypothetical protein PBI_WHEATTHIN_57 [Gordonia phage WheatThin]QAU06855.1 hypothetical protein SEA_BRYLIE_58 [Gordonia phage Brylie]QAX92553.1 hypothetical protein SEA_MULCH_58 [Gordonia phage Mulch]
MYDTDTTPTTGIEIRRPGPEPGRHSFEHFAGDVEFRRVSSLTPRGRRQVPPRPGTPGRHAVEHFEARGDEYITVGTLLYRAALTAGNGAAHYLQGLGYSRLCAYLLTSLIGGRL